MTHTASKGTLLLREWMNTSLTTFGTTLCRNHHLVGGFKHRIHVWQVTTYVDIFHVEIKQTE